MWKQTNLQIVYSIRTASPTVAKSANNRYKTSSNTKVRCTNYTNSKKFNLLTLFFRIDALRNKLEKLEYLFIQYHYHKIQKLALDDITPHK